MNGFVQVRAEKTALSGLRTYVHIGTGNYNPKTAGVYTDFGLLTCCPSFGRDVVDLFKYLTGLHSQRAVGGYKKLIVARDYMKHQFCELINQEILNAQNGKKAGVCIKVNGLDEQVVGSLLYG